MASLIRSEWQTFAKPVLTMVEGVITVLPTGSPRSPTTTISKDQLHDLLSKKGRAVIKV